MSTSQAPPEKKFQLKPVNRYLASWICNLVAGFVLLGLAILVYLLNFLPTYMEHVPGFTFAVLTDIFSIREDNNVAFVPQFDHPINNASTIYWVMMLYVALTVMFFTLISLIFSPVSGFDGTKWVTKKNRKCFGLKRYLLVCSVFLQAYSLSVLATIVLKRFIGYPAPDFVPIAVRFIGIHIAYEAIPEEQRTNVMKRDFAKEELRFENSMRSFPCGHAAGTFPVVVLFTFFLWHAFNNRTKPAEKGRRLTDHFFCLRIFKLANKCGFCLDIMIFIFLITTEVGLATFICANRIRRFRQHPQDVVAGILVGTFFASVIYYTNHDNLYIDPKHTEEDYDPVSQKGGEEHVLEIAKLNNDAKAKAGNIDNLQNNYSYAFVNPNAQYVPSVQTTVDKNGQAVYHTPHSYVMPHVYYQPRQ